MNISDNKFSYHNLVDMINKTLNYKNNFVSLTDQVIYIDIDLWGNSDEVKFKEMIKEACEEKVLNEKIY